MLRPPSSSAIEVLAGTSGLEPGGLVQRVGFPKLQGPGVQNASNLETTHPNDQLRGDLSSVSRQRVPQKQ